MQDKTKDFGEFQARLKKLREGRFPSRRKQIERREIKEEREREHTKD